MSEQTTGDFLDLGSTSEKLNDPFVGRIKELELLNSLVNLPEESKCVYIFASGGMGKTHLQKKFALDISSFSDVFCSGIIDFYDPLIRQSHHSLAEKLVESLDPGEQHFQHFRQTSKEIKARKPNSDNLQDLADVEQDQQLNEIFVKEWNILSQKSKKVVLLLDTFELATYGSESISEDAGNGGGSVWLLQVLPKLRNTLIVISSRTPFQIEQTPFLGQLNFAFKNEIIQIELGSLQIDEVKEFIRLMSDNSDSFTDEEVEKLIETTKGNPLLLQMVGLAKGQYQSSRLILHDEMYKLLEKRARDEIRQGELVKLASLLSDNAIQKLSGSTTALFSSLDLGATLVRHHNWDYASRLYHLGGARNKEEWELSRFSSTQSRGNDLSETKKLELSKSLSLSRRKELLHKSVKAESGEETDQDISSQSVRRVRRISVNQALKLGNRIVILGDPGSGKTTLLKYILLAHAENHPERLGFESARLPLFIRLYDYASRRAKRSTNFSLVDYLYTQAHESYILNLPSGFFEERLQSGRCCVCLDGLDELGESGLRQEIVQEVHALSNRFPNNQYVVTSRLIGYQEAPLNSERFVHFTILPFSDDDIRKFVKKWYLAREKDPGIAKEQTQNLIDTIMTQDRIRALASNPLMLTIIALVHRIEAELPNERVKLYDKCVTTLTDTWDKVKGLKSSTPNQPQTQGHRRLLERLAFWMHSQAGTTGQAYEIHEGDLLIQLQKFLLQDDRFEISSDQALDEAKQLVNMVQSRTGILIERGERVYAFVHLTFQEYLAACDIESRWADSVDDLWHEIQPLLYDSHWREVILLLFGSLNKFERSNTKLVERLLGTFPSKGQFDRQALFLATRILSDNIIIKAELRRKIFDALHQIVIEASIWSSQALSRLLEFHREPMVQKIILGMLTDKKLANQIREKILSEIREFGDLDEEILDALRYIAFSSDDDLEVRQDAAFTLSYFDGAGPSLEFLLECTKNNKNSVSDRSRALWYIGHLPTFESKAIVMIHDVVLGKIRNPEILIAAGEALATLGDLDGALPIFKQLFRSSSTINNEKIRITAIELMGKYGKNDVDTIRDLSNIAQSTRIKLPLRLAACKILALVGQKSEVASILKRMSQKWSTSAKEEIRLETALLMNYTDQKEDAIQILLQLARSKKVSFESKTRAAIILHQIGETFAAVDIVHLLEAEIELNIENKLVLTQTLIRLGQTNLAINLMKEVLSSSQSNLSQKMIAIDLLIENNQEGFVSQSSQQIGNLLADAVKTTQQEILALS